MTTGQLVFYSGVGLLVVTLILAVVFWVKKPQYTPESAAHDGGEAQRTQKLRSGYPTDPLTRRRDTPAAPTGTAVLRETERLTGTAVLEPEPRETEKLERGTAVLEEQESGTAALDGTEVLPQETERLTGTAVLEPESPETVRLGQTDELTGTERLAP